MSVVPHVAPLVPAGEDWLLAGPAAPRLHVEPIASMVAAPTPGNDLVVLDNEDAAVQPGPRRLPSMTVMDLGDEPRVQLWEGEAYEHFLVDGARVYPPFPPASPRTDARRRLMTSMMSLSHARRQAMNMDAPVFSMSNGRAAPRWPLPTVRRPARRPPSASRSCM